MKTSLAIALLCMLFGQWPAAIFFAIIAAVLKPR